MAKPGRNNPCPCGSGKKYKRCCLDKDVAAELEHERLAAAAWRPIVDVNIVNRFDEFDTDDAEDELTANSNAAVDLVDEGRLDEAEQVARHLLERFPDAHDGSGTASAWSTRREATIRKRLIVIEKSLR